MKFYAVENENQITALAEFETEQARQEWLDCNTEYDKIYGNKGNRKPIEDERIINAFVGNPLIFPFPDDDVPNITWYAVV